MLSRYIAKRVQAPVARRISTTAIKRQEPLSQHPPQFYTHTSLERTIENFQSSMIRHEDKMEKNIKDAVQDLRSDMSSFRNAMLTIVIGTFLVNVFTTGDKTIVVPPLKIRTEDASTQG
jgi:phage gp29-like protein